MARVVLKEGFSKHGAGTGKKNGVQYNHVRLIVNAKILDKYVLQSKWIVDKKMFSLETL